MRWLIVILSFMLASCAYSPPVQVEEQGAMALSDYQTFSIDELPLTPREDISEQLSSLTAALEKILASALMDENLSLSRDAKVSDISIQLTVIQRPVWDVFETYQPVYIPRPQEHYIAYGFNYHIAIVTIRMIESNSGKLVWRTEIITPLVNSEQQALERLKEHVGKLFL